MTSTPTSMMSKSTPPAKEEEWEMEFDRKFPCLVKPVGYSFTKNGKKQEVEAMTYETDTVLSFIRFTRSQAYEEGRREAVEEIEKNLPSKNEYVGETCVGRCACFQAGENHILSLLFDDLKEKEKV